MVKVPWYLNGTLEHGMVKVPWYLNGTLNLEYGTFKVLGHGHGTIIPKGYTNSSSSGQMRQKLKTTKLLDK